MCVSSWSGFSSFINVLVNREREREREKKRRNSGVIICFASASCDAFKQVKKDLSACLPPHLYNKQSAGVLCGQCNIQFFTLNFFVS